MAQNDPRHNARIIVLQKLFERSFHHSDISDDSSQEFSDDSLVEINELEAVDNEMVTVLFNGVLEHRDRIDTIIAKLAPQWPLGQIAKSDLQILRIAVYEGFIGKITPEKVAIDEAIELSKEFAGEQSRKFINGVLGNLIVNKSDFDL
ncbi:MAG: hypothetical protein TR69_WS6001000570 [candidate division WS6 bacterium OLB20]|uniref:Transcription antitermination protein NusB n=1 Tax=candidate division WS6 bacterium OLB20 TaxID=1617426 RepID=A0A136LY21_9BACT|nr:MAG: hypothetical protein TR69_WS6001000570 [candidate division WS6 bacterium OLB20]